MRSQEFESKTVEEAISYGLQAMDLSLEEVTMEVLEEGSKGLFGLIGAKSARVRLTEKAPVNLEEDEIKVSAPPVAQTPKSPKPPQPQAHSQTRQPHQPAQTQTNPQTQSHATPQTQPRANPQTQAVRKPNPSNPPKQEKPAERKREPFPAPARKEAAERKEPAARIKTDGGAAAQFITELAKYMEVEATVQAAYQDGTLHIDVFGDEKGILIGHRGETLDALQYLTSLVHNKDKEPYERLQLDSQNYRKKREETLVRLANRLADKARRTRRRVTLEPMNPYERRILHSALQGNPHVTTHSEGDEPNRHVVIQPK